MQRKSKRSSYSNSNTTLNVNEWMRTSGPRTLDEVDQLNKGMRKNAVVRRLFEREVRISESSGRTLWYIQGHCSTLVLASKNHRAAFRKRLDQRLQYLNAMAACSKCEREERARQKRLEAEMLADPDRHIADDTAQFGL
jgi:hypothetical protein